ncbi:glycosyltransferase family 4 protein [Lacibacterium aquatile]|uniref:Glycosyltransferase family 4 protein n=1 Tax=Lacibacterium aquatile TaxID=1168082 RepID=A0ABW5DMZ5_9PROT
MASPIVQTDPRPATVLQVLPRLQSGGVERTAVDVAAALVAAGCRAIVVSAGGQMVHELTRVGAEHIQLPVESKSPWTIWRNISRLADLIKAENVDIVHARSRAPAWSAYFAARRTGRPFVTTVAFNSAKRKINRFKKFYSSIMARGDLVIANSYYTAENVRANFGVPDVRVRVIPRGINLDIFDPAAVSPERIIQLAQAWRLDAGVPVVMMPARITRAKGHATLIQAMAQVARPGVQCLMVGTDGGKEDLRQELEKLATECGVGGTVRFVGDCRDMAAAYMLADVVVSASTEPESFGRTLVEAQAMGRVVVATDHGGARETVVEGQSGWLVPPGDVMEMANALRTALVLPAAVRAAMGAKAQARARQLYAKEAMTGATLAVYNELLAGRPV